MSFFLSPHLQSLKNSSYVSTQMSYYVVRPFIYPFVETIIALKQLATEIDGFIEVQSLSYILGLHFSHYHTLSFGYAL
jgi:hypothetical protein